MFFEVNRGALSVNGKNDKVMEDKEHRSSVLYLRIN